MKNLKINKNATLREALNKLSDSGQKCLLVVNNQRKLDGTLSDGDIRNAILSGKKLNDTINEIYNHNPTFFTNDNFNVDEAKKVFIENKFDIIPIVDDENKIKKVLTWEKIFKSKEKEKVPTLNIPTVIMAGGKGTRLKPFTNILPKPLIPINGKTAIEEIINRFRAYDIRDFYITINYKSKILKAYFEEINKDYRISYIEESKPLGTAGSLKNLYKKLETSFFVINCDVILDINFPLFMIFTKMEVLIYLLSRLQKNFQFLMVHVK